jgi:hypothetical protein
LGAVVGLDLFETNPGYGLQGAIRLFAEQASDRVELGRESSFNRSRMAGSGGHEGQPFAAIQCFHHGST